MKVDTGVMRLLPLGLTGHDKCALVMSSPTHQLTLIRPRYAVVLAEPYVVSDATCVVTMTTAPNWFSERRRLHARPAQIRR